MKTSTVVLLVSVLWTARVSSQAADERPTQKTPIISGSNETEEETSSPAGNQTEGRSFDLDLFRDKGGHRRGRILNRNKVKVSGFIPLVTLEDEPQESVLDYPVYPPQKSALPPIVQAHQGSGPSRVQTNFDRPAYPEITDEQSPGAIYQEKVQNSHRPVYPRLDGRPVHKEPKFVESAHRPHLSQHLPSDRECVCVPFYLCKNGILEDFGRNKEPVDERSAPVAPVYFDQRNHSANSEETASERIVNHKANLSQYQTDLVDYASDVMARFVGLGDRECGYLRVCCHIPPVISPVGSLPPLRPHPVHQVIPEIHQPLPPIVRPPLFPNPNIGLPKPKPVYPGEIGVRPGHFHKSCGVRNAVGIHGRVQNLQYYDDSAEFGEYPWHAAILKKTGPAESLYVCGATLVHPQWVVTAAHCLKKQGPDDVVVRLGEWDVHRGDEFYPYKEKYVSNIIVHPHYFPGNFANDIALLKLDSPLDPKLPHITPACLPEPQELFVGQRCWVTGWGKSAFGHKGEYQSVLKEVDVPVLSHKDCQHRLQQTRLGPYYRLHPSFVCAGGEPGKDACTGDGGSPMVCQVGGIWKVVGLVSWGIGCGIPGIPGVYVNTAFFRPWIDSVIHKLS
uniref:Serine protease 5 n=1 Tax=Tityus serrulatus TaxID=6887 RepID=A0A1S5QN64_TITSE|nr:serine protease 5 [Tityus serrulatus]